MDNGMYLIFYRMVSRSSSAVFEFVLDKVHNYMRGRILDTRVAGRIASGMYCGLCRAKPERALKVLLPPVLQRIKDLLTENVEEEQNVDQELLFNMLLLTECVYMTGEDLLPYLPAVEKVLEKTLLMASKEGREFAALLLNNVLRTMTSIYPNNLRTNQYGYDRPVEEYLPIRDWGRPGNMRSLTVDWHIPSSAEIEQSERVVQKFLSHHLNALRKLARGEDEGMTKERLKGHLHVVHKLLAGAGSVLPFWTSSNSIAKDVNLNEGTTINTSHVTVPKCRTSIVKLEDGVNVRLEVIGVISKVQDYMLCKREDDTQNLILLSCIYNTCTFFGGVTQTDHDGVLNQWSWQLKKQIATPARGMLRQEIQLRLVKQHYKWLLQRCHVRFTDKHKQVMDNLMRLSTSHYSSVRQTAQATLLGIPSFFRNSERLLLPRLTELLSSPEVSHDEFKGTLYIVKPYLALHCWTILEQVWPLVVNANLSEKPSIVELQNEIYEGMTDNFTTFDIEQKVNSNIKERSRALWDSKGGLAPISKLQPDSEIDERSRLLADINKQRLEMYYKLLSELCDKVESGNLHWRHYKLAIVMLVCLTRKDIVMPARVVSIFVENLIHDDILMREWALYQVDSVLQLHKKDHPKKEIYPTRGKQPHHVHGDRPDNLFMCYNSETVPRTEDQWKEQTVIHQPHLGYYIWPKKMTIYADAEQASMSELSENEKVIINFFADEEKVSKLLQFLSLEENKGRDIFSNTRFIMFKKLFRNYGGCVLTHLRPQLKKLIDDTSESAQRCAAEVVAGLIRGSKHWTFKMTEELWSWLSPLLRKALEQVSAETKLDWVMAIEASVRNRDPNRIHQLLEILMEDPVSSKSSIVGSSRVAILTTVVQEQGWRVPELLERLLGLLRPHIAHSYDEIRWNIGVLIGRIYWNDIEYPGSMEKSNKRNPKVAEFISEILPHLQTLMQDPTEKVATVGALAEPKIPKLTLEIGKTNKPVQRQTSRRKITSADVLFTPQSASVGSPSSTELPFKKWSRSVSRRESETETPISSRKSLPHSAESGERQNKELPFQKWSRSLSVHEKVAKTAKIELLDDPRQLAKLSLQEVTSANPVLPSPSLEVKTDLARKSQFNAPRLDTKDDDEKKKTAVRLLRTVNEFVCSIVRNSCGGVQAECFSLLEILCISVSNELEPDLANGCLKNLSWFSSAILSPDIINDFLDSVRHIVAKCPSWKAKTAALDLLQVSTFFNMPTILTNPVWISQVISIIVSSGINAEHVEVRTKAGTVLAGLLHCNLIGDDKRKKLIEQFKKMASTKINGGTGMENASLFHHCHSGIIGLCALVSAFPYSIPDFVPDILMILSRHLHDPQPIPAIIKETLQGFKRTHHDDWQEHKQKFTEHQLDVLDELLVSQSYFS